uniref:Uncharacterized protein n=1 Tax=Erpetoichthys calabaricus TaxID=27687 RepID=A0A8C4S7W7_ERPCA
MLRHTDGRVRIRCQQHESMNPACLLSKVQASCGSIMVWGMFSWHTLGLSVRINHHFNTSAYLIVVADDIVLFQSQIKAYFPNAYAILNIHHG